MKTPFLPGLPYIIWYQCLDRTFQVEPPYLILLFEIYVTYETSWSENFLLGDKKKPLLLLRNKWNILREIGRPSFRPWASYQKSVNATLDTGQPATVSPTYYYPDHLPPVILLPETCVHLASLPPTPRDTFVYLIFRAIQQPLCQLLPPVLWGSKEATAFARYRTLSRIFFLMEFANSWTIPRKKQTSTLVDLCGLMRNDP